MEVCTVLLPGREERLREPSYTRLPPLIEALAEALLPYLDKPFALFGHSMGALISFELSRELRRKRGLVPLHLFVSARRAPQIRDNDPPTYDLPEATFLKQLRRFNGTPQEVFEHSELMGLLLPVLRADFAVCQTYTYTEEPLIECPISVFGGLQDYDIPREYLEAWREQTAAYFSLQMLPGDHFFLRKFQPLLLSILAQQLRQVVRRAS